jgi:hypothetical protein
MVLYVFQVQGGVKPIRSRVLAEKCSSSDRLTVPLSVTYIHTHLERYLVLTFGYCLRDPGRFSHRVLPVETFNTDRKYGGT